MGDSQEVNGRRIIVKSSMQKPKHRKKDMASVQDECCPDVCEKAKEIAKLAHELINNSPALHEIAKDLEKQGEDLANLANLCGDDGSVYGIKNLTQIDEQKVATPAMSSFMQKGAALATSAKSKALKFGDVVSRRLPTSISCEFISGMLAGVIVGYATAHMFVPRKQKASYSSENEK